MPMRIPQPHYVNKQLRGLSTYGLCRSGFVMDITGKTVSSQRVYPEGLMDSIGGW